MSYTPLPILYYKDKGAYDRFVAQIQSSDFIVRFPIRIGEFSVFYASIPEIAETIERIYRLNWNVQMLWELIPTVSHAPFHRKALVEEVMWSNEVEGIHSSRKELQAAFEAVAGKKKHRERFSGLLEGYNRMLEPGEIHAETPKEIRDLYDVVLLPDIDSGDHPDGKIFRKGSVSIVSATDKEMHRGIQPESELISFVESSLEILRNREWSLPSIAAFHYLFGYAHPFYDGNGRMARFLCCAFLSKNIHPLIGLNLSLAISGSKKAYYDAFNICNDKKALGDITPFVLYYLSAIERAAKSTQDEIEVVWNRLLHYSCLLYEKTKGKADDESSTKMLSSILESSVVLDTGVSLAQLCECANLSLSTVRSRLHHLRESGVPIFTQTIGHAKAYRIDLEKL
jgi:Fic family protein